MGRAGRRYLRVEEYLGSEESLVADVDGEGCLGDGVPALEGLQPLPGVPVVLGKLLGDVRAHVAVLLLQSEGSRVRLLSHRCTRMDLDGLGRLEGLLGRDAGLALPEEALDEVGDVPAGDGDVLDAGADDVALGDGDAVGDAVPGVHDEAREGPVGDVAAGPGGGEGEDGLDGDVEAGDVEGLEHDLRRVLPVLGRVQRRLRLPINGPIIPIQ